jgi:hypothetical protein
MVPAWAEALNLVVGVAVGITFIVTFSVAAANGGFVNVDDTGADNVTLATIHYAADALTNLTSALDIDIDTYGPTVRLGCKLAEVECPQKISGVAVASIVMGVLALLMLLLGLWLRAERRQKRGRNGARQLYPDL